MEDPTILIAFSAGLASFIAPCILPMIPAFLAYISGTTLTEINNDQKTKFKINKINIIANTIFFVLGFSVIFSTLGVLINSILSENINQISNSLNGIAGIIIITFGIFL
ncbi:cytochrome c biogenesis protein CcdA, partial [Nitrosopumilus sp.]|nr:cytochrome c biogenesis protein CcdA [Nitrosopumilus sp.]